MRYLPITSPFLSTLSCAPKVKLPTHPAEEHGFGHQRPQPRRPHRIATDAVAQLGLVRYATLFIWVNRPLK